MNKSLLKIPNDRLWILTKNQKKLLISELERRLGVLSNA
jgi:hypothetical protein